MGAVDLPIQRERTTHYPMIQGSGVKGSLRSHYSLRADSAEVTAVFGPDTSRASDHAAAISVGDARLLAFPVRSLRGVMAWVTSVDVLARFIRAYEGQGLPALPSEPQPEGESLRALASSKQLCLEGSSDIILEEFVYTVSEDETTKAWAAWLATHALPQSPAYQSYFLEAFRQRFVVLPREDFRDFAVYATEIETRIKLVQATKTVQDGGLFTQEALPADCLLYAPIAAFKPRILEKKGGFSDKSRAEDVLNWLSQHSPDKLQIGGDETIGYGFTAIRWA